MIVIHEVPGITPKVIRFADEVVERGFTVVMPDLVGTPGREFSLPYTLVSMVKVCVSREFTSWALDRTSPITAWRQWQSSRAPPISLSTSATRWRR